MRHTGRDRGMGTGRDAPLGCLEMSRRAREAAGGVPGGLYWVPMRARCIQRGTVSFVLGTRARLEGK